MKKRTEYIKVKGSDPVEFNIYSADHGLDLECPVFRGVSNTALL